MDKKWILIILAVLFVCVVAIIPKVSYCQTATPTPSATPTATAKQTCPINLIVIGGIVAVVALAAGLSAFLVLKKRVNEKSLRKFSFIDFQDWILGKFGGKPSDPSSGVDGFTEGGQPLLIRQSDNVTLPEVENFVKILANGKAQNGTIVAFSFDNGSMEGREIAMNNGIDLHLLRVGELLDKRYSDRIKKNALLKVTFEAPLAYEAENQMQATQTGGFENVPNVPKKEGVGKPRVFISNSNTKVADQVKRMLDFLHYDYVMGDKEQTTVPLSDSKFGLMKNSDCAIINIAAAEQERRYSGDYILNPNVISEINAAYLNYNGQVILLVERKVALPPNLRGLKRIEYDTDNLSFDAAMDLNNVLADFKRI